MVDYHRFWLKPVCLFVCVIKCRLPFNISQIIKSECIVNGACSKFSHLVPFYTKILSSPISISRLMSASLASKQSLSPHIVNVLINYFEFRYAYQNSMPGDNGVVFVSVFWNFVFCTFAKHLTSWTISRPHWLINVRILHTNVRIYEIKSKLMLLFQRCDSKR